MYKIYKFRMKYIISVISIFLITSLFSSCKMLKGPKSGETNGIVLFHVGKVKIYKADIKKEVAVKIKDIVKINDIVKTGTDSFVTIQFQEKGVIRVQEKSTLEFKKLFSGGDAELYLKKGEVLSKIEKLQKDEGYMVKTPTAVASVRGTEFITQYDAGKSTVAVSKGKVSVAKKSALDSSIENQSYKEEQIVSEGNTAIVDDKGLENNISDNVELNIRPMEESEKLKAKKMDQMKVIHDVEIKDEKELIEINTELMKTETTPESNVAPSIRQQKIKNLIKKKNNSLAEIKEVFNRIDEITLYNQRVINGAIISRGEKYKVLTTTGTVTISEAEIKRVRVIK